MIEYLNYGAMGLGLALMVLSYRLLAKESARETVRNKVLYSIFTFFGFSLLVFVGGIFIEINGNKQNGNKQLVSGNSVPAPNPEEMKIVEEISSTNPAFNKVAVDRDVRVFDLRSYVDLSKKDNSSKHSKVNMTRYMLLRKTSNLAFMRVRFATSGDDLRIRCLTQKCLYNKKEVAPIDEMNEGRKLTQQWEVQIDVSKYNLNDDFLVIIEATYINAFQGINRRWVGALADYQTSELGILAIFPKTNPFNGYILKSGPRHLDQIKRPVYEGIRKVVAGLDKTTLFWRIKKPEKDTVYGIDWTW